MPIGPLPRSIAPRLIAAALTCSVPTAAGAQNLPAGGWSFAVTPYIWFASLEGDVGTISALPPVSVDADFGDIIENTDMTAMLAAEARRGRFGIVTDINFLSLSTSSDTPGPFFSGARIEASTFFATVAGAYRVWTDDRINVDAAVGARLWYVDTEIDLRAGLVPVRSIEDDGLWADPVIGLRGSVALGRGFSLTGAADIGGFGLASDFTWQILGTVDYRFADWFSARAGYRHLDVDYEDDGFVWDVELSGPIIGASFHF
jgi:hypothetical protein